MFMATHLVGFGAKRAAAGGGGGSPAVSFLTNNGRETLGTTETYNSQTFGDEAADRHIIVGYYGLVLSTAPSCTIGGVSATLVASATAASTTVAMFIAAVPTGTTGSIVFTVGSGGNRHNFGAWRATGLTSATATAFGTDSTLSTGALDTTFSVSAGGIIVGYAATNLNTVTNIDWSGGVTEDFYATTTNTRYGGASGTSPGGGSTTPTATYTGTTNGPLAVFATWA